MWLLLTACAEPVPPAPPPVMQAPVPSADLPRVVFLGDSLTAAYGLPEADGFPARLGRELAAMGLPIEVVNAGVSGDTSAGGLRRVDWLLRQEPDVLVLALGANDMLRGLPPAECKANLRGIVERARTAGADVLLLGMRANPTLGPDYVAAFDAIYPTLSAELDVPLVPFLLDGVAGEDALNQGDGIHPTVGGHARIATEVLPILASMVREAASD